MGKRIDWTDEQISSAVKSSHGNLTEAAKLLNHTYANYIKTGEMSKVSRQNLQTWIDPEADLTEVSDNFSLQKTNRRLQLVNSSLRRSIKAAESVAITKEQVLIDIQNACQQASKRLLGPIKIKANAGTGKGITIELLFSDLQIGKLMGGYNSKVAYNRVNEWSEVVMERIEQYKRLGYKIDGISLALLGDIIESDKKHGLQSARACDIGTADQIKQSIDIIYNLVIRRLAEVGAKLTVICITGNHDWDGHGLFMFNPGKEQLSWPLYHALKNMTELSNIDAEFVIPEGAFHVHDIYGTKVLYEHGVGVGAGYTQMKNHLAKRTDQLKTYITLFRMGDKHNICQFNNNRYVVNGAFFGDSRKGEEYSGIAGYDGEPAQIMFAHVKREDNRRTTIFDSFAIQLGHIGES
jgi:hypothetical protein